MLQLTPQSRILLATEPVDFRKGIDGLAAVCRQKLREQPLSGAVFVLMLLSGDQIVQRIHSGVEAGGNQAREHAGDIGAVGRSVEETVFPLANGQLQRPLRGVVLQRRPRHFQKRRQITMPQ